MSLMDSSKYIQRLVRVISEKEKLIDQLRREAREHPKLLAESQEEQSSMAQQALRQELSTVNRQVKSLVEDMNRMQQYIAQLNSGLQEETAMNQQLQRKIKASSLIEQQLRQQIKIMQQEFEEEKTILWGKYEQEKKKVASLEEKIEDLKRQKQSHQNCLSRQATHLQELAKWHNQIKSIGQIVEGIFAYVRKDSTVEVDTEAEDTHQELTITAKLTHIQSFIKETLDDRPDFLNNSIDGISAIMKSVEEKLEEMRCHTDRSEAGWRERQLLKASSRSVPPVGSKPFVASKQGDAEVEQFYF